MLVKMLMELLIEILMKILLKMLIDVGGNVDGGVDGDVDGDVNKDDEDVAGDVDLYHTAYAHVAAHHRKNPPHYTLLWFMYMCVCKRERAFSSLHTTLDYVCA